MLKREAQICGCIRKSSLKGQAVSKKQVYNTAYSQVDTQPSTDAAQQGLTSVIGREPFFFLKWL